MKILICGLGSIGLRHLNNLVKLGYKDIIIFSSRKPGSNKIRNFQFFKTLKSALNEKPNLALICNSTHLHEKTAINCIKNNVNVFLEKPVGYNKKKLLKLKSLLGRYPKNKNMVGYMMRFHPAIKKIKEILKSKYLGTIFHFSFLWGEYFPNWHKNENYKKSYAANKKMGGGAALTLSHDLDLSKFFFGEIKKVKLFKSKINTLGISAENSADFLVEFKNNIVGNIHLDYLQKKPMRFLRIIGSNGKIEFDYYNNELFLLTNKVNKKIKFKSFQRNQLFIDEIKYVLDSVKKGKKMKPDINESINLLKSFKLI